MDDDDDKKKKRSARTTVPATVPGAVSVEEPSVEAPDGGEALLTSSRRTASSNGNSSKSKGRRTAPATVPGAVAVGPPSEGPDGSGELLLADSGPSASSRENSGKGKARRTTPATTPGAVAVGPSTEPDSLATGEARQQSMVSSRDGSAKSKARRSAPATAPGAVAVGPDPMAPQDQKSSKGKHMSSSRATAPGAVAVAGGDTAGANSVDNLNPDHVKTLSESFGFPLLHSQKGLLYGGGTVEGAVEWIYNHQNDQDLNDPIPEAPQEPEGLARTTSTSSNDDLLVPGAYSVDSRANSGKKGSAQGSSKKDARNSGAVVPGAVAVAAGSSDDRTTAGKLKQGSIAGATTGVGLQVPTSRGARFANRGSGVGMSSRSAGSTSSADQPGAHEVAGGKRMNKKDAGGPDVLYEGAEAGGRDEGVPGGNRMNKKDIGGPSIRYEGAEAGERNEGVPGAQQVRGDDTGDNGKNAGPRLLFANADEPDEEIGDPDLEVNAANTKADPLEKGSGVVASMGVVHGRPSGDPSSSAVLNAPVQNIDDWKAVQPDTRDVEDGKRKCRICAGIIVLIIAIVIGVVVGVTVGGGSSSTSEAPPPPTPSPSAAPTADFSVCFESEGPLESFSSRYNSIREILVESSTGEVSQMDVPNTPQRKALCWVSEFDALELSAEENNAPALLQRYTMAVFYYALVDESASDGLVNSNWLSGDHECMWQGLGCTLSSQTNTMTTISLRNQLLGGSVPGEVGDLGNLEIFNVGQNELISGSLPASFWDLTTLVEIMIQDTAITGTIPSEVGNLSNLRSIFALSLFTGTIPEELTRLTDLVNFVFKGNIDKQTLGLNGTIPSLMGRLTSLELLDMEFNRFTGAIPSELGQLTLLRVLDLSHNEFTGFSIPSEIGLLIELESLLLMASELNGTIPSEIGELQNLETLHVSDNNDLSGTIPSTLGNLRRAESMHFHNNMLSGSVPAEVCELRGGVLAEVFADCARNDPVECLPMCCTGCF